MTMEQSVLSLTGDKGVTIRKPSVISCPVIDTVGAGSALYSHNTANNYVSITRIVSGFILDTCASAVEI